MRIAVVRGDFGSQWEMAIFAPWCQNNEVTFFTGFKPVYKLDYPAGMKVERLPSPVDLNFGKVNRYLMAILNRIFIDAHVLFGLVWKLRGYDVVYTAETFYFFSLQAVIAKKLGFIKKVVIHVGENILNNNEGIWGRRMLKQFVIKNTDVFVAITDQAKKVLILEGADPKKIMRLNLGVDLTKFTRLNDSGAAQNDEIRLLVVSRLVPEKGIREICVMFNNLKNKFKNLKITFVGTGPEKLILDPARMTLYDRLNQKDLIKLYQTCDVFVHYPLGSSSWQEQFGFVLVEAMACGLPVIALDRGSVKEVVGAGGIVASENLFEKRLEELIKDKKLRKEYANKAFEFAHKNYNVDDFSKSVLSLLSGPPN